MHLQIPRDARKLELGSPRLTLDLDQGLNNWNALNHACALDLMPTHTLDIHFECGGIALPLLVGPLALRSFLKSARQWIERRGHRTALIWVLENRGDDTGSGLNAHVLIHVPPELSKRFEELWEGWARTAGFRQSLRQAIKVKRMRTRKAVVGKFLYMTKDLEAAAMPLFTAATGQYLHDSGKPSNQPVHVKKTGVSRNIDAGARASHRQAGRTN